MSTLLAIVYPDIHRAAEVRATLNRLQMEHLIDMEDACVVTKEASGKIHLHQTMNLTAAGLVGGAFWGTLIGLIFFAPVGGLVGGAIAGGLSGSLYDYGISDDFMKKLAVEMQPNSSAIFALIQKATMDKITPQLAKFGGNILHTSLSYDKEAELQTALNAGFAPQDAHAPND